MTKERIAAAVERTPEVKPVLVKLAGKVARGVALPAMFSENGLSYAAQRELEALWGVAGKRTADGRVSFPFPDGLREPSAWREAMEYFGLRGNMLDGNDAIARLELLRFDFKTLMGQVLSREAVKRFIAKPENRKVFAKLFMCAAEFCAENDGSSFTTLSQLGSDWFNDSKSLRSGPLLHQLVAILEACGDTRLIDSSPRDILAQFGIVDNPYTTHVTVFAPIQFWTSESDADCFDFPNRLFQKGMACQLPLETVGKIKMMAWLGENNEIVTCENAAPFAQLVRQGVPAIYTEGYANYAVKKVLAGIAAFDVKAIHMGDVDLDGFLIASDLLTTIPVKRVMASEVLEKAIERSDIGIPLTAKQRKRAESFLAIHTEYIYGDEIRRMLKLGRWIEQESFASILGERKRRWGW